MEKSNYIDFAQGQYDYAKRMSELYGLLQDQKSKDIFWARMKYDTEPSMDSGIELAESSGAGMNGTMGFAKGWKKRLQEIAALDRKIVLYGAGSAGNIYAGLIQRDGLDFYAFVDKAKAGGTFMGKPVLSPDELVNHPDRYEVIITSPDYALEIQAILEEKSFPSEHVFYHFQKSPALDGPTQYFEFPNLFKKGTAFIDAGCYDGADSIRFSEWCGGNYSKIYAFEPDQENYANCQKNLSEANVPRVEVVKGGLSNVSGSAVLSSTLIRGQSYILVDNSLPVVFRTESEDSKIRTFTIDDIADVEVGMIKMDIEGSEFAALNGGKATIQRDRPFLAICVYHLQGDMLAIMDYLHMLVPEYRFWLRHYGQLNADTVLYASV